MIETFKIGSPVVKESNPTNAYRLHIEVMHGDADHYETVIRDYILKPNKDIGEQGKDDLELILAMLKAFFSLSWNDGCDNDKINEAITEAAKPFNIEFPTDIYGELIPNDITYVEVRARPMNVKLTYFNENGIEHEVEMNGKWKRS